MVLILRRSSTNWARQNKGHVTTLNVIRTLNSHKKLVDISKDQLPTHGSTTIQNPDGKSVPVIVSRYGCLLEVDNGWLTSGVHPIRCVSLETFPKQSGHSS